MEKPFDLFYMPVGEKYEQVAETVIKVSYTDDKFRALAHDETEEFDADIPDVEGRPVRLLKNAAHDFFRSEITKELGYQATAALRSAMEELTPKEEVIGEPIVYAETNSNRITVFIVINDLGDLMKRNEHNLGFLHEPVMPDDFIQKIEEMNDSRRLQYTQAPVVMSLSEELPDLE